MNQLDDFTYVVKLAPGKTSFYDPVSQCNLFLSRPVFGFNIEPTTNILRGLKAGVLTDVKGNLKTSDIVKPAIQQQQATPLVPAVQNGSPETEASTNNRVGNRGGNRGAMPAQAVSPSPTPAGDE